MRRLVCGAVIILSLGMVAAHAAILRDDGHRWHGLFWAAMAVWYAFLGTMRT